MQSNKSLDLWWKFCAKPITFCTAANVFRLRVPKILREHKSNASINKLLKSILELTLPQTKLNLNVEKSTVQVQMLFFL